MSGAAELGIVARIDPNRYLDERAGVRGVGHGAPILPVARRPALPPAGRPVPSASDRSNTSASPEGYDVAGLFQTARKFAERGGLC
jgi:hypothetical protein